MCDGFPTTESPLRMMPTPVRSLVRPPPTPDLTAKSARTGGPRGPQMIAIRLGGDDGPPDIGGGPDDQRYGFQLYALVSNLLNHLNPTRYGNVVGSPLFGQPVEAVPGRRLEIGARFRF